SVVSIVGGRRFDGSSGSGTASAPAPSFGCHWYAPAGLWVSSHSKPKRVSKKLLSHVIGVGVQVTSMPLVIASRPAAGPKLPFQPSPCCSIGAASGSRPTAASGPAPWVLPKV